MAMLSRSGIVPSLWPVACRAAAMVNAGKQNPDKLDRMRVSKGPSPSG
jgi:hypothetical protein